MEDKTFKREQIRRDLQEALNSLDEAITAEDGSKDQFDSDTMWVLKVTMLSLGAKGLIKTFLPIPDGGLKDELG